MRQPTLHILRTLAVPDCWGFALSVIQTPSNSRACPSDYSRAAAEVAAPDSEDGPAPGACAWSQFEKGTLKATEMCSMWKEMARADGRSDGDGGLSLHTNVPEEAEGAAVCRRGGCARVIA